MFTCCFNYRFSATATLDTAGVSHPMADPSAAQQWPIKNLDAKVGETPAATLSKEMGNAVCAVHFVIIPVFDIENAVSVIL